VDMSTADQVLKADMEVGQLEGVLHEIKGQCESRGATRALSPKLLGRTRAVFASTMQDQAPRGWTRGWFPFPHINVQASFS